MAWSRSFASVAAVALLASMASVASAEPIEKPQRAQLRHFGFFHTEPEGLLDWQHTPEEEEDPKTSYFRGCTGLNAALAQKIDGIPGRRIFVIPGDCCMELVNKGPVEHPFPILSGVRSTEEAIKHGMGTGGFRRGFGIVPDGVIAVRLSPTLTAPVIDGTFYTFSFRGLDIASLWKGPRLIFGASADNE